MSLPAVLPSAPAPVGWNLSCLDWEQRLREGRSLVPDLPLDLVRGDRAVAVFNKLRLADVPGTPTMAEGGGEWFRDIVRALFGAIDQATQTRMIRELFLLVPKKNSKALALDTLIATPGGFTTMGVVQVGDWILAADGKPTRVLAKSELFVGHECYEVEFSTGEKVVCDAQHLWVTDAHLDRGKLKTRKADHRKTPCPTVKTTAEIARSVKVKSGRYEINNHRTALCDVLDLPPADLPIPPYALGAWLGDGHTDGALITASRDDAEIMVANLQASGQPAFVLRRIPGSGTATISMAGDKGKGANSRYRFRTQAVRLGVLGNKHLPQIYLRGSRAQRLELLCGLMDTDGTISKKGQASFTTTLPALRDGMVELVNSLGLKASFSESRATLYGKDCGPCWDVQFWPFDEIEVFKLPRKIERQRATGARNSARSRSRQIVAVRPVPSVPTQCISVESKSKQFLVTQSLVPTHNTTDGALLMLTALLLNERPRAPFLLTAPVQKTTEEAFSAIAGAIALDPVLDAKLHVRDHLKTIVHRETKARLEVMTFDPTMMTGRKVAGALIDEQHVLGKMPRAEKTMMQLRGGMQPFPEAFLAIITTQSDEEPVGVFLDDLNRARDVRDGKRKSAVLPVLYEFPSSIQGDPEHPWKDPALWPMVTPNLGKSISLDRLIASYEDEAAKSKSALRIWASQHLNIQIGLGLRSNAWVGANFWEQQALPQRVLTLDELIDRCEIATIGLDGGGLDDIYGMCVLGRERGTGRWLAWCAGWIHESVLELRKSEASRFLDFQKQGDLHIVTRVRDDIDQIAALVAKVNNAGLLARPEGASKHAIGVDTSGLGDTLDALAAVGIEETQIVGISQGWRLMTAIQTTERRLAGGELWHAGSPLMAWCVGNAKTTPRGNAYLIEKAECGRGKIDPLMALFNAVELLSRAPAPDVITADDSAAEA